MEIRLPGRADERREYDAIVVGSGFGSALAALPLVQAGARAQHTGAPAPDALEAGDEVAVLRFKPFCPARGKAVES